MAGNADVSYDDDQQQAAVPKVTETWDAVTGSRKHTEALGSAQTSTFWGHEDGPAELQGSAADMFHAVSGLLAHESNMLKKFEADMHEAMTRFTARNTTTSWSSKTLRPTSRCRQSAPRIRPGSPRCFTRSV